jgi:ribosome biogenesis GTPase
VIDLHTYGYDDFFATQFALSGLDTCIPGRVVADFGGYLRVATPDEYEAEIAGALLHTQDKYLLPKVGDFVAIEKGTDNKATIRAVLTRRSEIDRKSAGSQNSRQVLAANVDVAFVVQALDHDFSPTRLERYMYQLAQSNIETVFVFNKADKAYDSEEKIASVTRLGMPVILATATTGQGIDEIRARITGAKTAVFLGSSGVGKSTLTNQLLGSDQQKTAAIRERDSTGRHTTSHRELFLLPSGGMIIDTPGIRELQLWGEEEFLAKSFGDIEELALACEFNNCSHTKELHCAVLAAIDQGALSAIRLESYLKFKQELRDSARLASESSMKQKKQRARRLKKAIQLDEKLHDDEEQY